MQTTSFAPARGISPTMHDDADVFSRICQILVKRVLDLQETSEFYELQFLTPERVEAPALFRPDCGLPDCPSGQMHFDLDRLT